MRAPLLLVVAALWAMLTGGCTDGEEARFLAPLVPQSGTAVFPLDDGERGARIKRSSTTFWAFVGRPEDVPEGAQIKACRFVFAYETPDTNQVFFGAITDSWMQELPGNIRGISFAKSSENCRAFPDQGGPGEYSLEAILPSGTEWPFAIHFVHLFDPRTTQLGIGQDCSGFAPVQVEGEIILLWIELDWEAAP